DDDANGYVDDVYGWDFANNDNDPMDDFGHGTHTAGTIAAVGNNGIGVVGVSWQARVMSLKFMGANGSGTLEAAAQAVLYAARMGARVSSNSWGCLGKACFSQTLLDAINEANQQGMLFVAAAGNDNNDNDRTPTYPCNYDAPNVLCVAASDYNDQRATFYTLPYIYTWASNYGAVNVDLAAPGLNILSTVPSGTCPLCSASGYLYLSGTSMATPHVAGAAALAITKYSALAADQIKSLLIGSVDALSSLSGITVTGGRLNVNTALHENIVVSASPVSMTAAAGQSMSTTITYSRWTISAVPLH
ncbi:MAG: S8 family peptidase, partial [Gallionellaceae bacterium]|nr:S8 family peptidase [Gallionellaceae bacterium]